MRSGWPAAGGISGSALRCCRELHNHPRIVVGTRQDMAEVLAFAVDGKVKADIELQPLSSINQIFARLDHGDVASRGSRLRTVLN